MLASKIPALEEEERRSAEAKRRGEATRDQGGFELTKRREVLRGSTLKTKKWSARSPQRSIKFGTHFEEAAREGKRGVGEQTVEEGRERNEFDSLLLRSFRHSEQRCTCDRRAQVQSDGSEETRE